MRSRGRARCRTSQRCARGRGRGSARALSIAVLLVAIAASPGGGGCTSCSVSRAPDHPDPSASLRTQLGTNLDFLADWSTAMPFVDLMKTSRGWIGGTLESFDDGSEVAVDERGWVRELRPGQVARALMAWDMTTHPAGRYVVLWEGSGAIDYFGGATGRRLAGESGPHRDVLDLDPRRDGPGIGLAIVRTDPRDPIRDVRVLVPGGACSEDAARYCDAATPCGGAGECRGFEEIHRTQVFHPRFLASLAPYSVIRFMNWADANSTIVGREGEPTFESTWSSRTEPEDARWTPRAPLEVMIDLANRTHTEPWLTLPARADDDYARRAGALVRQRLDPDLRVWVEYSNEVWNTMFPQSAHAAAQGLALGLADDPDLATIRYYSRRTGELHRAFGEGLGEPARMVRVYAGQSASPWRGEQILDFEGAASRADVFAIAPYFGHTVRSEERDEWARMSLDRLFARARSEELDVVREHVRSNLAVARERNLPLVAYEGGQHFVGYDAAQDDERITRLFEAANRDPRMGEVYDEYLALWRSLGGGLFVHLVDCAAGGRYGFWGATEWLGQPLEQAPKRRALERFSDATRLRAAR